MTIGTGSKPRATISIENHPVACPVWPVPGRFVPRSGPKPGTMTGEESLLVDAGLELVRSKSSRSDHASP